MALTPEEKQDFIGLLLDQDPIIFEDQRIFEKVCEAVLQVQKYGSNDFIPLEPTRGQREFLKVYFKQRKAGVPVRILILKARQLGISTMVAAILTIEMFMRKDLRCAVAAHVLEGTADFLYDYYANFLKHLPDELEHFKKKKNKKGGHVLAENDSYITVEVEAEIRGRALDQLHLSEAAFFKDLPKFMGATDATLAITPGTAIFMESTANGYDDDFHRRYDRAVKGEDAFEAVFLGWYLHPDYSQTFRDEDEMMELFDSISVSEHPRWGYEMKAYRQLIDAGLSMKEALQCIKWRRWKLTSITLTDFYREYPTTADEAFQYTDKNVFDPLVIETYKKEDLEQPLMEGEMDIHRVRFRDQIPYFIPHRPGILKVYGEPKPDEFFIFGIDTSRGKRDYCACQVIRRHPLEQVAVLRGYEGRNLIPLEFAEQVYMLYKWYNEPYLAIENNDSGLSVINSLLNWGCNGILTQDALFPNLTTNKDYGWRTEDKITYPHIVNQLRFHINNKLILIHDEGTLTEMSSWSFLRTEGTGVSEGKVKAMAPRKGQIPKPGDGEEGFFDDRIISLGGALVAHLALPPDPTPRELAIAQAQTDHADLYGIQPTDAPDWWYDELGDDWFNDLGVDFDY